MLLPVTGAKSDGTYPRRKRRGIAPVLHITKGVAGVARTMKYLVFTNTPAHVHLYRNAVQELVDRGHEVLVLGREYACTRELLEEYDLPFEIYGRQGTTSRSLFLSVPSQFAGIARRVRSFDPDLVFGRGAYAAFAGTITGTRTILVLDSEPSMLAHSISSKFADAVISPNAFEADLGEHHYRFRGLTECAYLHPEVRETDPSVRTALGIDDDEQYVLLRFNAYDALHDVGQQGFTPEQRRKLIRTLADDATVFVSDESEEMRLDDLPAQPYDLHPARIHDAMAEASLLVADTGTMTTESALLGTPTIRSSPHVGDDDMGEFRELADAGLVHNLSSFETVLDTARELVADSTATTRWERKRDEFLRDRVNLTRLLVDIAEQPDEIETITGATPRPPAMQ